MKLRPFLQLVRFPLAFTAIADSWAGYWIGLPHEELASLKILAVLAWISASFYMMGMALNDLADRERDAALHPGRPLPSATVGIAQACLAIAALAAAGLWGLTFLPHFSNIVGLSLLLCIIAYDLSLKKSRAAGALAMGTCRALNLYLGCSLNAPDRLQPAIVLGVYVAVVTLASTLEESRPAVQKWVRWSLWGIIPLDAALAAGHGRAHEAGAILLLLAPRWILGRWIPVN